jgi:hypothetical protein
MAATATLTSSLVWIIVVVLMATLLLDMYSAAVSPEGLATWTIQPRHDPPGTASYWLGFAFNSTLGYPGKGPPTPLEFDEGTELWLQQLEEEKRLIEELPCVQQVKFYDHEADPNLNYIQATLWCCWQGGRFKQMKEATDQTGNKPTHLEAARALRGKIIEKHAFPAHVFDHRAVARRAALEGNAEATPEATAFDRTVPRVTVPRNSAPVRRRRFFFDRTSSSRAASSLPAGPMCCSGPAGSCLCVRPPRAKVSTLARPRSALRQARLLTARCAVEHQQERGHGISAASAMPPPRHSAWPRRCRGDRRPHRRRLRRRASHRRSPRPSPSPPSPPPRRLLITPPQPCLGLRRHTPRQMTRACLRRWTAQNRAKWVKRLKNFRLRRKQAPKIFACGADVPHRKLRLHDCWTPPTRALAGRRFFPPAATAWNVPW